MNKGKKIQLCDEGAPQKECPKVQKNTLFYETENHKFHELSVKVKIVAQICKQECM